MNTFRREDYLSLLKSTLRFLGTLALFEWFVFNEGFASILNCFDGPCWRENALTFVLMESHLLPIIATCTTLVLFKYKTFHRFGIALNKAMWRHLIYGLICGAGMMVLFYAITHRLEPSSIDWFSEDIVWNFSGAQSWNRMAQPGIIMLLFMVALGISQEIFFRGFLFSTLTRFAGAGRAMWITAIAFAFYSLLLPETNSLFRSWADASTVLAFGAFGLLVCVLALRTRMIWMSIGLNVGFMALWFYPNLFGYKTYYRYGREIYPELLLTLICLSVAAIIYFRANWFTKLSKLVRHQRAAVSDES